ncbi:MAG TPA: hypothetical protein PKE32_09470 [Miltoncostaeaceae bacterium]|nr:hypothetical protein [Miltoncostaeaceae bacterium]
MSPEWWDFDRAGQQRVLPQVSASSQQLASAAEELAQLVSTFRI